jgi:hypothetical protein
MTESGFDGLGVSALAFGTQVAGFKPVRSRRIFQGEKILSAPSFGRAVKPWVPCRWFTACKRSLDVSWKSASRQNKSAISRPHSSGFGYQDCSRDVDARNDWRWKLERLKQGKYNKPHWLRYIRKEEEELWQNKDQTKRVNVTAATGKPDWSPLQASSFWFSSSPPRLILIRYVVT